MNLFSKKSSLFLVAMLALDAGWAQAAPIITSIIPSSGPTIAGTRLTINGTNFSASGNAATVGGAACGSPDESTTVILCDVPEGTGSANAVQVVDSLGEPSNTQNYSRNAPSLSMISPSSGPTDGGTVITLTGSNFGPASADAVRSVTLGTSPCALVPGGGSHTSVECTTPEGQGMGQAVSIAVDGQLSGSVSFSYSPPSITNVDPSSGPPAGGNRITISGASFGTLAAVTVGGSSCPIDAQTHSSIECTAPSGSGVDAPVVVFVSGQASTPALYDYVAAACGDGTVDVDEDCDDTNSTDLDGCSAACETEHIQDKDNAGCIVAINKAAAKVMKAQAKDVATCAREAAAGVACIGVTNSKPLDSAIANIALIKGRSCVNFVPSNFNELSFDSAIAGANTDEEIALAHDMFGADPDAALVPSAMAPNRASCQQDVLKATNKLVVARLKAFGKCKKAGFKDEIIRAPSQLAGCLDDIDDDPAVAKPTAAQFQSMIDSCLNLSEDLAAAFPGVCSGASNVAECIQERVRCRTCRALVATDGLDDDCDGHDDGTANASCP